MKKMKIYNTQYETSIRLLVLINTFNKAFDFHQLVILDYLLLHIKDIDITKESMHPDNPFHIKELFIRRQLIRDSLNLLLRKGLINYEFGLQGILYRKSEISNNFLKCFETEYFNNLICNSKLLYSKYSTIGDILLDDIIKNNHQTYGHEFEFESLFRGDEIG